MLGCLNKELQRLQSSEVSRFNLEVRRGLGVAQHF